MRVPSRLLAATALCATLLSSAARAEEGMWTFDNFPAARMKAQYGWAPDQMWLDRVRAGAVRLTSGCSASFVSSEGLILTNNHCVTECLQNLTSASEDLVKNGFVAADRARERQCPGVQAEVVTGIRDVTADVTGAIGTLTGGEAAKARSAAIARIEKAGCTDLATQRCQVVTLYGGGRYALYTYRKYSDVRIAWAPELQAGFFGGDPDNFNYPRYALDASFLRAYENGRPAVTPNHLKWSARAPQPGEATFVVGNPGTTQRGFTTTQLAMQREMTLPLIVTTFSEKRGRLIEAMNADPAKAREGADELFGLENGLKVFIGRVQALSNPQFYGTLAAREADLKARGADAAAFAAVDKAVAASRSFWVERRFSVPDSKLLASAITLVEAARERAKPDAERAADYRDSNLALTEKALLDPTPAPLWLERLNLEWSLSKAREYLGADHPQTRLLLGKESPEGLAKRLTSGTGLADPAVRRALWQGGAAAIAASTDPMIVYARSIEPNVNKLDERFRAEVEAPLAAAQRTLTAARFAAYGAEQYPDATFSLRISYGRVEGWNERGTMIAPVTTIGGMYDRATGAVPFDLPRAFAAAADRIDRSKPFNYVTTNDIIGGNSGSPVLDRDGHVIGAAFDGNIHSLGGNYGYDGRLNRTVAVSTVAIAEAMRTVYPQPALLAELQRGAARTRARR